MSDAERCPRCKVLVGRAAKFCGACQCPLPPREAAPPAADEPAPPLPAFDLAQAWAPPDTTPDFFPLPSMAPQPRDSVEARPEPVVSDTPAAIAEALRRWRKAISFRERFRTRGPRPEAQVRAALAQVGPGPVEPLLAWFSVWDGQTDEGCFRPHIAQRALSLDEALQRRHSLLGLGEGWDALKDLPCWLPLLEHASADLIIYVAWPGRWGVLDLDHTEDVRFQVENDALGSLVEYVDEATAAWT